MNDERSEFKILHTASDMRKQAREKLFRRDGSAGYGSYLLGRLSLWGIAFAILLGLCVCFMIVDCVFFGSRDGFQSDSSALVITILMSLGVFFPCIATVYYLYAVQEWGLYAMAMATVRNRLKISHGLSGFGHGWRMARFILMRETIIWFWPALGMAVLRGLAFAGNGLPALFLLVMGLVVYLYLSYAMASYLLIDHPDWTSRKCLSESKRMMAGHRWRLFCLYFSFIGWAILLGCVNYGISYLFSRFVSSDWPILTDFVCSILTYFLLEPYVDTTCAVFYEDLVTRAKCNLAAICD